MSLGYTWVQWSGHKRRYDLAVVLGVIFYIGVFVAVSTAALPSGEQVSEPILLMRATGSCAIVLLHVILCIGPLARLDSRFLPVLYNRRHLGVVTFLIALAHAVIAVGFYHGFGVINPLLSLLASNTSYFSLSAFPFQTLGLAALVILFLLAATSHDFWLKTLSPRVWKSLHMSVYAAYALLVGHVALGALQTDRSVLLTIAMSAGVAAVVGLHLAAGRREVRRDAMKSDINTGAEAGWIDAGRADEIPMDRARTVCAAGGERIAIFRHGGGISAVTNVCEHQGGPLGEGKIIDGCITCPWHGWQYRPGDGTSPPPFTEKIATYQVRIVSGRVQVKTKANEPGTAVAPAISDEGGMSGARGERGGRSDA
jgi:methionine sulfoxide reductase heme-binding subunit